MYLRIALNISHTLPFEILLSEAILLMLPYRVNTIDFQENLLTFR